MNHGQNNQGLAVDLISPGTIIILIIVSCLYLFLIRMKNQNERVPTKKIVSFFLSMMVLYISMGPLNALGHSYLFSAHMLQQSLLFFVFPLFLLAGLPDWFYSTLFKNRIVRYFLTGINPFLMALVFNTLLSFYHFPVVFDFLMSTSWGMLLHGILTILILQIWIVILPPTDELARLPELQRMAVLILNGLLLYPACAVIIFAGSPMYAAYEHAEQLSALLGPINDQQLGGVIMKFVQEGALAYALARLVSAWRKRELVED